MVFRKEDPASQCGAANRAGDYEWFPDTFNTDEYIPATNQSQSHTVATIAKRHRLTAPHARVVVELAGLGVQHG